jgi:hypothetical protein
LVSGGTAYTSTYDRRAMRVHVTIFELVIPLGIRDRAVPVGGRLWPA